MNPARWQRVRELFERSLECGPAERPALLASMAADDPALRAEVETLLAADERAHDLLDRLPRVPLPPSSLGAAPACAPGDRLGPYRIVREIGQGGMATVYLAERTDGQFRQLVAIKLLRPGMASADLVRRFRAERQILASLEHPNIARLIDGGLHPDGRPYLVMEHVEGEPIDTYCDRRALPVDARLRLFRRLCDACHHAHRSLVVHRDLKPANVLVTPERVPKLLDFGIARLLSAPPSDTRPMTRAGLRFLSPEYASPEQIRGDAITTASDVYALGLVLYELLTGVNPQRRAGTSQRALEEAVCTADPAPPSRALVPRAGEAAEAVERAARARGTRPERLGRLLRGDLDTIVLMALRKEPERRYASAEQLSEDVRRHLAGLPVAARGDGFRYRASRFARRHAIGTAAGAIIALLLLALAGLSVDHATRTASQARRIAAERDRAAQASTFLQNLLRDLSPEQARDVPSLQTILQNSAVAVEMQLRDQPDVQAALLEILGSLHMDWGLLEPAEPLLRRSLVLRERLVGPEHADVASTLNALGVWHWRSGQYDRAADYYTRALAMKRAVLGGGHPDVARTLNNFGVLRHDQGEIDAAARLYEEALAIRRRALPPDDPTIALSLSNLAAALRDQGDHDASAALFGEVLERRRRLHGDDHPSVATTLHNLAFLHQRTGDYPAAERLHRDALARRVRWFGDDHHVVANSLHNLGRLLMLRREYAQAEEVYRRALDIRRSALPADHPQTAGTLVALGATLFHQGQVEAAEPLLQEGLAARSRGLPGDHWLVADAKVTLGGVLTRLGRYDEAEALLHRGHAGLRDALGEDDPRTATAAERLAGLYDAWGDPERAAHYRASVRRPGL